MNKLVFTVTLHTHAPTDTNSLKANWQWEDEREAENYLRYRKCENVISALNKQPEIVIRTSFACV